MPFRNVSFSIAVVVPLPPRETWRRLTSWGSHGEWVPFTDVVVHDPRRFTATTKVGSFASLVDTMEVVDERFDGHSGSCRVAKLGPVLDGEATFTVAPGPTAGTTTVAWAEALAVPHVPRPLAPLAATLSGWAFRFALWRMARRDPGVF